LLNLAGQSRALVLGSNMQNLLGLPG